MFKNKINKAVVIPMALAAIAGGVGAGILSYAHAASADTATTTSVVGGTTGTGTQKGRHGFGGGMNQSPHVDGKITAINGSILTVASDRPGATTSTTYTVDVSGATISKITVPTTGFTSGTKPPAPTTITIADLSVGDSIMAQGTLSGTTLTATKVMTGTFGTFPKPVKPAAEGKVTAVSGNTITLTGKDNTTYTVDASSATIMKAPARPTTRPAVGTTPVRPTPTTITVSDIQVGDTLMVTGTANGTSVVATSIFDGKMMGGFGGFHGHGGKK